MKKTIAVLFVFSFLILGWQSCNQTDSQKKETATTPVITKEAKACTPIKDPNNPKPMALMMRMMAANADSMRSQLLRGESLDSTNYPFIKFYLVEPTDPNVLEPQFFENARLFQQAYKNLFAKPKDQIKRYNLLINSCIKCHESYCSGPLKRIRKFPIAE